ncbi:MAG: nucleoside monophosphate kinase [Bacteroidetes bacterium]|nr:nucleoside monophosphate kinase [Bacteroidota bacterium]
MGLFGQKPYSCGLVKRIRRNPLSAPSIYSFHDQFNTIRPPRSWQRALQAERLKEHFNLLHISTGDLLRKGNCQLNRTQLGLEAKKFYGRRQSSA